MKKLIRTGSAYRRHAGYTLVELLIAIAILGMISAGFAAMLRYSTKATIKATNQGQAQEDVRRGLMMMEQALVHANQINVASSTLVEFVCDMDQSRFYDPNVDNDGDGIPNHRDGDRDNDVMLLMPATAQWQVGYNLKDDDEDGDGMTDVRERIYLSGKEVLMDTSINEEPWGNRVVRLAANISTFTLTYLGNKANQLGRMIDLGDDGVSGTGDTGENDGIITAREMDWVQAPAGMGDRSGSTDTANERRYITSIRIFIGADRNNDGNPEYTVETDVYPPLLPLKSR
ncbi:MAG: type II secretion system protein [bacterium]